MELLLRPDALCLCHLATGTGAGRRDHDRTGGAGLSADAAAVSAHEDRLGGRGKSGRAGEGGLACMVAAHSPVGFTQGRRGGFRGLVHFSGCLHHHGLFQTRTLWPIERARLGHLRREPRRE